MENTRVSELAKELGMTSKEVIEKFAEISITVKSHSNVVTPQQIRRLKEHLGQASGVPAKKPKAFVVKKTKSPEKSEAEEKTEEKLEKPKKSTDKPLIEIVKKSAPAEAAKKQAADEPEEEKTEVKPEKKAIKVEHTKIEYSAKKTSRIEIVRRAPQKPPVERRSGSRLMLKNVQLTVKSVLIRKKAVKRKSLLKDVLSLRKYTTIKVFQRKKIIRKKIRITIQNKKNRNVFL